MTVPRNSRTRGGTVPAPRPNQTVQSKVVHQVASFSGPIPDPNSLKLYGDIDPSIPDRLISLAERQESHRLVIEQRMMDQNDAVIAIEQQCWESDATFKKRGQILGFVFVSLALSASVVAAYLGHDWVAGGIVSVISASMTAAFIVGRKDHDEKPGSDPS
ncbi:MAG: hypothetical protein HQM04_18540 [Magnetococcales bacterium]|nr:hypothetical protein [Magnetococcales bacterium]